MARKTPSARPRAPLAGARAGIALAAAVLTTVATALPATSRSGGSPSEGSLSAAFRSGRATAAAEPELEASSSPKQRGRAARVQPRGGAQRPQRGRAAGGRRAGGGGQRTGGRGAGAGAQDETPLSGNPFGVPVEQKRKVWFQKADADSTGWVSFREARVALGFDAARFRVFDTDNDGRFTQEEYTAFLRHEVGSGREPIEPRQPAYGDTPPPRDAEQLRVAYDVDLDGEISRFELDRILLDYGGLRPGSRIDLSAAEVMQQLDTDGDRTLDVAELGRLANYLTPASIDPGGGAGALPGARSVDDLFANSTGRTSSGAPRITGPVSTFRRLDIDGDGYITPEDLERLEGRAFSTVNLSSLINTLDIDFDGRLHEGEFLDALSPRRR